jgi:hypothetical protein
VPEESRPKEREGVVVVTLNSPSMLPLELHLFSGIYSIKYSFER